MTMTDVANTAGRYTVRNDRTFVLIPVRNDATAVRFLFRRSILDRLLRR
jgi:hypothetical protein